MKSIENKQTITLRCDCHCCMLVIDKEVFFDGEIWYNISMQDSSYNHNYNTIWGRIKRACKCLFGKPIYYNDICINESQKFLDFVSELNKMIENNNQPE